MAKRKFKKINDAQQRSAKLGQMIAYATANLASLPALVMADITAMTTIKTNLDASIAAEIAAQAANKQATITKKNNVDTANAGDDLWVTKLNAQTTPMTDVQWQGFGYPAPDTEPTQSVPNQVLNLVMHGTEDGTSSGKFDRNGNIRGTVFILYARTGSAGAWVQVGTTTSTTVKHEGQTPGVHMEYQVVATRGNRRSAPSNVAVVYA